jgi:general secretion pathway protein A
VLRAIPIKLQWTTVSSYPSMGAGVSVRIGPLTRGPISSENHFAFRENPFSLTPNPRFLHRTRQAHETLGRLTRGILDKRGLILLCGPVGTGKTTLLYSALHLMDVSPSVQNKIGTAMIVHPTLTPDEFLEAVLDEFDVECASTRRQWRLEALLNMLLEVRRRGGVAVLVIDEAQMLSAEVLEEVRTLLSLQTSREKLLQIVLCGQPELEAKLQGMSLRRGEPFVAVRCGTVALSLQDTHDYVQHRLRIAGARSDALFTPEAVNAIHAHTGGIPRLINLLCGQALSVASFHQAGRVFPYMVDEAAGMICSGALVAHSDSIVTASPEALASAAVNLSSETSGNPLLAPSVTTMQGFPLLCDSGPAESSTDDVASAELEVPAIIEDAAPVEAGSGLADPETAKVEAAAMTEGADLDQENSEPSDAEPAKNDAATIEGVESVQGDSSLTDADIAKVETAATIEGVEPVQAEPTSADTEHTEAEAPVPVECAEFVEVQPVRAGGAPATVESAGLVRPPSANAISLDASPLQRWPQQRSKEITAAEGASAMQAARKKRRTLHHRAKFAQAVRIGQDGGHTTVKCNFARSSVAPTGSNRRSGFRTSPFRRGKSRSLPLGIAGLRGFWQVSVADIAASLPVWNLWLNRWCSEHFTSKSCGKPLFQLGLAGTLFLALAQVIAAGFPRQQVAHVTFGFLGLLFIDISLGLGTYLLLIERRLTPGSRGARSQILRRLG